MCKSMVKGVITVKKIDQEKRINDHLVRYESRMLWVESPELNLILENEKLKLLINISCSCIYIWLHLFICRTTVIKERRYCGRGGRSSTTTEIVVWRWGKVKKKALRAEEEGTKKKKHMERPYMMWDCTQPFIIVRLN